MAIWCNSQRQLFVTGRFSPRLPVSAWAVVRSPGAGRFPAGELTRRPPLFATSAMAGGEEAHSDIGFRLQCLGVLSARPLSPASRKISRCAWGI